MPSVAEIVCQSRIEQVIVHARGALVTRAITLPALPTGAFDLIVPGVTLLATPGSARAATRGERPLIAIRTRRITPPGATARGDVSARRIAAERAYWKLDESRKAAVAERQQLMALSLETDLSRRTRRIAPADRIADALAASRLVSEQVEKIDAEIRALDEAMRRNTREREAIALEEAQARPSDVEQPASRRALEFVVRIAAAADRALESLAITYAIEAARWWPAYTARFANGGTRVAWAMDALVAQDSGEDWSGVRLAVSTADLVHDARLPELASLRLGRAQTPPRRGYRPPPADLDTLFTGFDSANASLVVAAVAEQGNARAEEISFGGGYGAAGGGGGAVPAVPPPRAGAAKTREARLDAGPPPMQAQSAPAPARPPPPPGAPMPMMADLAAAPKSRGLMRASSAAFGAVGSNAPRGESVASLMVDEADESYGAAFDEGTSVPDDSWLDFDQLVLAPTTDTRHRGRLVRGGGQPGGNARRKAAGAIQSLAAPAHSVDPIVSRGHFDYRFDANAPCDVASVARVHRVTLAAVETDAEMQFRTVPREQNDVFREAVMKNPFGAPMLSGAVDVFFDNALLTNTGITFVDRGGVVRLGLGVEERIRVARNARVDESTAGLLGGSTSVEHVIEIELNSSLGRAVRVDIIDRVPVTDDKDIEVTLVSSAPRAEPYDQVAIGPPLRGGLRFRADVPAAGRARVEYAYRVKLPAKSEVIGGNRRD